MNFSNYGDIITFDTFLQGLILIFCLTLGCLIFFTDSFQKGEEDKTDNKPSEPQKEKGEKVGEAAQEDESGILTELNENISSVFLRAFGFVLGRAIGLKFDNKDTAATRASKVAVVAPVLIFSALTLGIFAKTAGEIWIKNGNRQHLGMKTWVEPR